MANARRFIYIYIFLVLCGFILERLGKYKKVNSVNWICFKEEQRALNHFRQQGFAKRKECNVWQAIWVLCRERGLEKRQFTALNWSFSGSFKTSNRN